MIKDLAVKHRFDYICVPCTQTGKDLQEVRLSLGDTARKINILAKVDTVEAVHQYDGILKNADGVILVRNELAFELPSEKLVLAQKWMITRANQESRPVFIQSQVLESMVDLQKSDQRLEAQEISSTVLEGADVFILSHETSIGKQPLEATILLAKAIAEAENVFDHEQAFQEARNYSIAEGDKAKVSDMLCTTATQIALDNNVDLFICLTSTGRVARYLAKQRPMQTILACSTSSNVVRQVNSSRGVIGYKVPEHGSKLP